MRRESRFKRGPSPEKWNVLTAEEIEHRRAAAATAELNEKGGMSHRAAMNAIERAIRNSYRGEIVTSSYMKVG